MLSKMSIINIILRLKFSFGCNSVTSRLQCICVHCSVYKARSKDGSDYWEKYPGQVGCKKCPDQDEATIVRLLSNDQCPIVHPAISGHTSDLTSMDDTGFDEKLNKSCDSIAFSHCVFCVRVGISDSLGSEWRDPPQSKWSKHAAMFSFSSSAVRDTSDQCRGPYWSPIDPSSRSMSRGPIFDSDWHALVLPTHQIPTQVTDCRRPSLLQK